MLVRQAQPGISYRVPCRWFSSAGSLHRAKPDQQPVPSVAPVAESFKSGTGTGHRAASLARSSGGSIWAVINNCLPVPVSLQKNLNSCSFNVLFNTSDSY